MSTDTSTTMPASFDDYLAAQQRHPDPRVAALASAVASVRGLDNVPTEAFGQRHVRHALVAALDDYERRRATGAA